MALIDLSVGPLLFNWLPDKIEDFYARIADEAPISRVYLGEVVCSKRLPSVGPMLARAADRLSAAGKTLVYSSLALPATEREQNIGMALANVEDEIEVNDMSLLAYRSGRRFVAGPLLSIYNELAARELRMAGCTRLCANVELSLEAISSIHQAIPDLPIEVFGFGRLPLALSGRCYHARAHGLHKDACQFVCDKDPDGRSVQTLEGDDFLAINGTQTLSNGVQVAGIEVDKLRKAGICTLRLSPHSIDMVAVAQAFDRFLRECCDVAELVADLDAMPMPGPLVSGYLDGKPGSQTLLKTWPS